LVAVQASIVRMYKCFPPVKRQSQFQTTMQREKMPLLSISTWLHDYDSSFCIKVVGSSLTPHFNERE